MFTADYQQQLRELHNTVRWGAAGKTWAPFVSVYAEELGARTILDYGCGRATLRSALPADFVVTEYDPGIDGKENMPLPADLVVCTDVMEHVEPLFVNDVLMHIKSLSLLGAFFCISLGESKVCLPDGRNSHLTIRDEMWWLDRLRLTGFKLRKHQVVKGLRAWTITPPPATRSFR